MAARNRVDPRLVRLIEMCSEPLVLELRIAERLAAGSTNLHAEALAHLETHLIPAVLAHTNGNQVQAAKILGIARNSLRKKLAAIENTNEGT